VNRKIRKGTSVLLLISIFYMLFFMDNAQAATIKGPSDYEVIAQNEYVNKAYGMYYYHPVKDKIYNIGELNRFAVFGVRVGEFLFMGWDDPTWKKKYGQVHPNYIYRMRFDGKYKTRMSSFRPLELTTDGTYLYYVRDDDPQGPIGKVVGRMDLIGKNNKILWKLSERECVKGLCYINQSLYYWCTDVVNKKFFINIYKASLDGSKRKQVYKIPIEHPLFSNIEWLNDKLFVEDKTQNIFFIYDPYKNTAKTYSSKNIQGFSPVDIENNYLYFIYFDSSNKGYIGKRSLTDNRFQKIYTAKGNELFMDVTSKYVILFQKGKMIKVAN
jgi:hypothetical protein